MDVAISLINYCDREYYEIWEAGSLGEGRGITDSAVGEINGLAWQLHDDLSIPYDQARLFVGGGSLCGQ